MTETTPTLRVDFNRADDDDIIWALPERASTPGALAVGDAVELYDHEGNRCLGYVTAVEVRAIYVRAEWSTWRDADPLTVHVVEGVDLSDALLRRVTGARNAALADPAVFDIQETQAVEAREPTAV